MLCGGKGKGQEGAPRITRDLSPQERADRIQKQMREYFDMVSKKASPAELKKAEQNLAKEMGSERFRLVQRFLPRMRRSMEGARRVYREFRMGRRIVRDRRFESRRRLRSRRAMEARRRSTRRDERREVRLRGGKLIQDKGRRYANYLADRMQQQQQKQAQAGRDAMKQVSDELLSKLEKKIIARFEGGEAQAKKAKDGKPTFLKKTPAEWAAFFKSFLSRTSKKRIPLSRIQEFLFRGVVPKGAKGMVIADMKLPSGRVERFVRFSILADAMAKLAQLLPGEKFGSEMLKGDYLYYLALAVAQRREYRTSPKPTQGLFVGGVAEEKAAQALGIPLAQHLEQKEKGHPAKKGLAAFGGFGRGKEREPEETPYRFVPWWHWGNLKRPGKFKMITVAFYIALGLVAIIGILSITAKLLK